MFPVFRTRSTEPCYCRTLNHGAVIKFHLRHQRLPVGPEPGSDCSIQATCILLSNKSTFPTTLHSTAQTTPHSTPCSAFAPPRALRKRSLLSATPPPAAGLRALARRASRAPPTTLSTVRGPPLSSTLLTRLVSGTRKEERESSVGRGEEGRIVGGKRHWDSGRRARSGALQGLGVQDGCVF